MARFEVTTEISAPLASCFDLARDLDLHLRSMVHAGEQAIAGRTSGLIELGEEVTWRAKHFGLSHEHTSRITAFDRPHHFRDEMVNGRFKSFRHDHYFEATDAGTRMVDLLEFSSPLGLLGWVVDSLFLSRYLEKLIRERNAIIKREAENPSDAG